MRITKTIAESIANELVKPLSQKIKSCREDLAKSAGDLLEKSIPKDVLSVFANHPKHFYTRNNIQLVGNGANYEWVTLDKSYPIASCQVEFDQEDVKTILGKYDTISRLEKEKNALWEDVFNNLLALKTYNKVEKEFPEASKYLPENISSVGLTIPMPDLRKKLENIQTL